MKILITGGAGFIGSNFIHYIIGKYQADVINLDRLTYAGNLDNLQEIADHPHYSFIKGDICDPDLVRGVIRQGVDWIINFAAESHVDRSINRPQLFLRTNVLGTGVLLEAARDFGISRFIQVSTDEVYGSLGRSGVFTEGSNLAPNSPYSASKAGADLMVRAYYQTFNLPVIITRCSNNYGPYQNREKLIPLLISNALQDKELPIYGDGSNIRDWIHVQDHCRALELVLRKGRVGEAYNIGGSNEHSNLEVARLIVAELGKSAELIKFVPDRPGHDYRYAIDYSKLKRELGFEPEYSFREGLRETIKWYQTNQSWWRDNRGKGKD